MELANIEKLLEAYFEGNTSLAQEQELRAYFKQSTLPTHLEVYRSLFAGFDLAKQETSHREILIPKEQKRSSFWNLSIAASVVLAIGAGAYVYNQSNGLTSEEEEALMAFNKTKEVMFLLSETLNEGTESVAHFNEFNKGLSTMSVLNQINESKNLILK